MVSVQLPAPLDVSKALGSILGKEAKAVMQKGAPAQLFAECFVGQYDDGAGNLEAVVTIDFALAATLGSALALIPAGVTKDAIKAKKLEGDMMENAYEVANILANSFVGKRVRLVQFTLPGKGSEQAKAFIESAKQTLRLDVAILPYPGGSMMFHAPALPA